ncbi:GTP-binding protein HSR1-related protein [Marinomonas posidonica IVIA-Po-181]|uniref:GTP-binding protein HSR1-related protein n=2 Tax=Marinomonas TaxID=28253 RepID=F6CXL2_MARPP|nr:GTP-binding protein HSR1-related protein [Marinomonas posidonica IVIA-Po-181]
MTMSLLVVGHANTGKTSLIRTLLRRHDFGEVNDQAGTTRHVESVDIEMAGQNILTLIDTPGFEDSIGLWECRHQPPFNELSGRDWLMAFCHSPLADNEFEQEAKILKQLTLTDIILYVIDLRQAPLGKYLDELSLLASANKPIIPILNFSASPSSHHQAWRQILTERHLHAVVKYDSVAFYFEDEKRLYQSLQSLMPDQYDALKALILAREEAAQLRLSAAISLLAEWLTNAASFRSLCDQYPASNEQTNQFEEHIKALENQYIQQLLKLYDFRPDDLVQSQFHIQYDRWQQDMFDKEVLKEWGIETGTSALTGAAIGAGIDMISAGLTLGTATSVGALLGAGWQTGKHYKDTIKSKLTKQYFLCLENSTLTLLSLRGLDAIRHLHQRGHASQQPFQLSKNHASDNAALRKLPFYWRQAKQHPNWYQADHPLKTEVEDTLTQALQSKLNDDSSGLS